MKTNQITPNNSWENIGKMFQYILEHEVKFSSNEILVFMYIVRKSFGYGCAITNRISISMFCDEIKASNKTIVNCIKVLIENNIIEKVKSNNSGETGKKASMYKVVFNKDIYINLNGKKPVDEVKEEPDREIECIKSADF